MLTEEEARTAHHQKIELLPSIHSLDFGAPPEMGDLLHGPILPNTIASQSTVVTTAQVASEKWVPPAPPVFEMQNHSIAPVKWETRPVNGAENDLEETSPDYWRREVRTRSQLRQILGVKSHTITSMSPQPPTTSQSGPPKRPFSDVDLTPAGSDTSSTLSDIDSVLEANSEPSDEDSNEDSDMNETESDSEEEQDAQPKCSIEGGIDSRYDPNVIQIKDGMHMVPRTCSRSLNHRILQFSSN